MTEMIDYGRFAERLRRVMPRWDERDRMAPEEFARHLADTGPRWELLREFQAEWGYEPPGGEPAWPRWSESEHRVYVRELKEKLTGEEDDHRSIRAAVAVPQALDEWWDLPFNSFTYQPRLYETNPEWPPAVYDGSQALPLDNSFIAAEEDRRVCVFMAENQYCNEWGYLAAEAVLPDPRVLVSTEDGWAVQSRSISEFFLQLAMYALPFHFGHVAEVWTVPDGLVDRVRAQLPPLGLLPWRELGAETTAYGAPDAIVFHDAGMSDYAEIVVIGRTREALERLSHRLGVDLTAG
ncbi:hypothetical protein [Streptosporangium roseum]|uniref:hypothetical protein n=1 Tax=Streptosporangium roseum TaxID=2001 RepID=UPI003325FE65